MHAAAAHDLRAHEFQWSKAIRGGLHRKKLSKSGRSFDSLKLRFLVLLLTAFKFFN
jgi:hypothetical protein